MKNLGSHRKLWLGVMASVLGAVLVLAACEPEQAPASAARTAAALRTPASAVNGQATAGPPQTLAPQAARPTTQPGTTPQPGGSQTQPAATPGAASLVASPNPVPAQAGQMGTTTISWQTGQSVDGQVYVSEDDGPEKLFASSISGSQDAPWIRAGHSYHFRLYAGSAHDQLLATLTVGPSSTAATMITSANPPVPTALKADPNPVPADDQELGSTIVTWTSDSVSRIYVLQDGGPEQLFASGTRGAVEANWICRGSTYEFRLYTEAQHSDPLKTVTVVRAADAPGHEPPPRVDCKGSGEQDPGTEMQDQSGSVDEASPSETPDQQPPNDQGSDDQ